MPRRMAIAIAFLLTVAVATVALASEPPPANFAPGRVIIKYSPDATAEDKAAIRADLGGSVLKTLDLIGAEVLEVQNYSVGNAVQAYMFDDDVAYIEPDYIVTVFETPNDPMFGQLWGLENTGQTGGTAGADVDATRAWDVFTGSGDVVVVVIDTGTDYTHPDIAANAWTNPGEIPGNGIDDDGNGFIDDIHGWDFYNDDNNPMDDHGHGTHCAGTIGAVGNNGIGVVGVNWTVKIMAVKFLSSGGSGSTSDAIDAIEYATMMGADVMSNSWGGGGYSAALEDAIEAAYAAGIMFVAAAGNSSANTDTYPHYPSSYPTGNVISVAATDHNDNLASFSNYGLVSVDLGAPGDDIYSTFPGNSYGTLSGTSMATPHVSGAVALVMGRFPAMNVNQVKALILNSVDPIPALTGRCVSEGRLNVFNCVAEPDSIPPAAVDDLAASNPASNTMDLGWTATGDDGYVGTASYYDVRYSTAPIDEGNFFSAARDFGSPDPGPPGTSESMMVTGLDFNTTYYFAVKVIDEYGNYSDISNVATGTTLGIPDIDVAPAAMSEDLISGAVSAQTLTIYNVGEGTLDFEIAQPTLILGTVVPGDYLDVPKGAVDPRVGDPVIDGQGGPDATGYRWIDSDEPGGPTFMWVDITGVGTLVSMSGDDLNTGPYPIGFDFEFYGNTYNEFRICTNGFISFTSVSTAYSNQPIPGAGAPENLVAPFWDDLNFSGVNRAYYYNDGTRLIVEWHDVPHYGSGGNYTFEVILYPDGTILYQYLTMGDPTNSATVGTQNAAQTDGLQVAFNADYIHDNLAVKIAKMPQWVDVSPNSGRVYGGGMFDVSVAFDATGLLGGNYEANIVIESNDPDEDPWVVPVNLHVTGAPDISVSPTAVDFGEVFIGATATSDIVVSNPGTDDLTISDITSDNADFWASPTSFTLAPKQAQLVTVSFLPSVVGGIAGTLTIASNDPDEHFVDVSAQGVGLIPPQFDVDVDLVSADLMTGETERDTLTITNNGGSDLEFTASVELYVSGVVEQGEYVEYGKEEYDPSTSGPQTEGLGGPDVFGYSWIDSDEPGGPTFDWVEISTIGTEIPLDGDDRNYGPYPIGFDFPFYGNTFSEFRACSNGWVSFTSTKTSYTNYELPNDGYSVPENLLAVWWDDQTFSSSGDAYYYNDGTRLIIEYKDVPRLGSGGPYTYEIILYPNGTIVFQYLTMAGTRLDEATIGIQNEARDDGLTVVHNADYMHDGLAIRFASVPEWLKVAPASGTVPAGESMELVATFNATDLFGGEYLGAIHLDTNDPNVPRYDVPATLLVTGAPDIAAVPENLDFGMVYLGFSTVRQFEVVNEGTDLLTVTNIATGSPEYSVNPTSFTVEPLATQLIDVSYAPSAVGDRSSILTVYSDDPDEPELVVPLAATCLSPPDIDLTPMHLVDSLFTGEVSSHALRVENIGDSDLEFTVAVELFMSAPVEQGEYVEYGKEEYDPSTSGPQTEGSGGPDVFGYSWIDSDEPGGPTFDWVEISTIGTPLGLTGDDQNEGPFPIGFDFPFYGNTFSEFYACSNGWVSFTSTRTTLTNYELPNSGTYVPENLLAVWWDDLRFTYGGEAYYYYDGTRLIIEYKDVPRFSTGGPYTFEIILYPNGTIVYQYLAMADTGGLDRATIGIQNETKDDGLTVVHNADYVHDGLAIRFGLVPEWLSVNPTSGTVPAGGFVDLSVVFDAAGLYGGDYEGGLDILSNDPDEGLVFVEADLNVTGMPDIAVDPVALGFGPVYISLTETLTVDVANVGTDILEVTSLTIDHPEFTTDLTPFTLEPMEMTTLQVVYTPVTVGLVTGTLTIFSNDADEPEVHVGLTGEGVVPPDIAVSPMYLEEDLFTGETSTQTVRVENTGGSDLDFSVDVNLAIETIPGDYLELGPDEEDPRPGHPVIDNHGGPDDFGYSWVDSDEPGGPVFDWVDITGVGTLMPMDNYNQTDGPFPIGFDFPFYGQTFSEFYACTNGWISFTNGSLTSSTNQPLPNTGSGVPENLIAALWDYLTFRSVQRAYYHYDGTRLIIQYHNVPRMGYFNEPFFDFEIILYPSGRIVLQYLTMAAPTAPLNSCTIGIQNETKDIGLEVVFNSDYIHENLAIEFSAMPEWLSVSPTEGTVPPGGYVDLSVLFDAADLYGGDYEGDIAILSNDPDEGLVLVEAGLHVTGAPDIDVVPLALDFGWLYIGLAETLTVDVLNNGTDLLEVTAIAIDNPEFTADPTPFSLDPRQVRTLEVVYTPVTEGMVTGTLTLYSNDEDEPEVHVSLAGEGVVPPEIEVDPDTLRAALMEGLITTKTLRIMNEGGSDLDYSVGLAQVDAVIVYDYLEVPKYEEDPRPGIPAVEGSGGPDVFGYTWIDSDEPGGPTYDWVEISAIGTPTFGAYSDDGNRGPFDIGFSFPFYEDEFTQFYVCSNGWLSFTSTRTTYSNQPLPNSGSTVPENLLAVWWDDMVVDPSDGNEIYYYYDGTRLIVQYEVRRIAASTPPFYSFQILLYPNGRIVYQYRGFGTNVTSATIGIQNATKDDGLTVVFNAEYVHPELAIEFSAAPSWLSVHPEAGVIPAGGYEDLTVCFDARELEDGLYEGQVSISSNDIDDPMVVVPAYLTVDWVEAAFMDIDPNTLNLGSNGKWVECNMGIPVEFDPMLFLGYEAFLVVDDDTLTPPDRFSLEGPDSAGAYWAHFKWDREAIQDMVGEAQSVEVIVAGEIEDINWIKGHDYVTAINPKMNHPNGGEAFDQGENLIVMWEPPTLGTPDSYTVLFSADDGVTWTEMASGITTQSVIVDVPDVETQQALMRVYALNGDQPIGYDTSDEVFTIKPATGAGVPDELPVVFALKQNWPNPFVGTTMLHFDIPKDVDVRLEVFDVRGRLVKSLVDRALPAGRYDIGWDGRDSQGRRVASGVYYYRIEAGPWSETKTMVVVR